MNKLVIIGNGFDLACKLESKFSQFFAFYKTLNQKPENKNFFYFLLNETFYNSKWKEEFQERLKINECTNWMDFELVLNHFLFSSSLYSTCKEHFRANIEEFYEVDEEYIEGYEEEIFKFFSNRIIDKSIKNFDAFLGIELNDFEIALCAYLEGEEERVDLLSVRKKNLLKQIVGDDALVGILNFNYTKMPEINAPLVYVHGNYFSENKGNIIIGTDTTLIGTKKVDFKTLGDKKLFTKTYRKLILNHDSKRHENEIFENFIQKIVFYGHSLGEQDYSYFQSIFDHCNIYESNIILEFLYSNYDGTKKEVSRTIERVYALINEYGSTIDNKDHGRNLLHKMLLEGRLLINEI